MKARTTEAVAYCRVSTWSQVRGHGLQRQMDYAHEYAEREGYTICACFCEVGSGEGELPIRAQALKAARRRKAVLLVEDYDRWTRKAEAPPDVPMVLTARWIPDWQKNVLAAHSKRFKSLEALA